MLQKNKMGKTSLDGKLGHLSPWCQQFSQTPAFAFRSAHQNVSQKPLPGSPAKDAPGLKPTALHTVKDVRLQRSCQARTATSAKTLTEKLSGTGITTPLNTITNGNDRRDRWFQPWPAQRKTKKQSSDLKGRSDPKQKITKIL